MRQDGMRLSRLLLAFLITIIFIFSAQAKNLPVQIKTVENEILITNTNHYPINLNTSKIEFDYPGNITNVISADPNLKLSLETITGNHYGIGIERLYNPMLDPGKMIQITLQKTNQQPPQNFQLLPTLTPIPVQVTVKWENYSQVISICNISGIDIPLNQPIEFEFKMTSAMPTSIWGTPWLDWKLKSQINNTVVLQGGFPWATPFKSDPGCLSPIKIVFSAGPEVPLASGPFIFRGTGITPPPVSFGNINVIMPLAPAPSVNASTVTIEGMGIKQTQNVNWGAAWFVSNLNPGQYIVSASPVKNTIDTFVANPISLTVDPNKTAMAQMVFNRTSGKPTSWNSIQHIVVVIFENTDDTDTLKQAYFKELLGKGGYFKEYYALTHPSQPNYIGMIAGSLYGVNSNSSVNIDGKHLGNLLNAAGKSWKVYAEDLPSVCFKGSDNKEYARKHEPFISFRNVQSNPTDCAKVVNGEEFFKDVAANKLPAFSYYVPNLQNDGHDTGVAFASNWLKTRFGPLIDNSAIIKDTLFMITFDEDDSSSSLNRVYTVFVGAAVNPGTIATAKYNHYSLLRTIEEIYGLGSLDANDKTASVMTGIWQP